MTADFLRNGMYGFAMGDAFGVPYEFKDTAEVSSKMRHGGLWSDDTSLSLATINALTDEYQLKGIMDNFSAYLNQGEFTPQGQAFGYGVETANAIKAYDESGKFGDFNQDDPMANGNGALMRIWPLAFYQLPAQVTLEQVVNEVTGLTHGPMQAKLISRFWVYFMRVLPRMRNIERALVHALRAINRQPAVQALLAQNDIEWLVVPAGSNPDQIIEAIKNQSIDSIKPTSYDVDTLNTVLWTVLNAQSYEQAVKQAVQLGGDTDTNAALVGLVMSYVDDHFPEQWFNELAHKEKIERELVLADQSHRFD
ncbi:ADP-ribosylglycohydrolase [Weissella uvarum]|uniref:ADP-ribosylglycohydrolase family protein n=1 Tax=Weissella uvarum TaxID=1479233 RepID=UPI0019616910|nr:ADP-ribosylglycohydrolase family protein [Weissella uvarum]MBM7617326.1 ADP-ribosylglycohydrolase [Weissella uvarum]MCM0595193.1 ADP-ribosylglycohydrolase family protein [Weissella uvarum]